MNDITAVRTDVYAKLAAAPATYPTYAPVPQGAAKPYIAFGLTTAEPGEELATATSEASFELNTWSTQASEAQTYAMLQFIRSRLDGVTLAGGGWRCVEEFWEIMEDPASTATARIYHGVARYGVSAG